MIWLLIVSGIILLFGVAAFFGAPYVPSQRKYVKRAFRELYPLGPDDTLVDIGVGDGLVLRSARSFGATAIGYEINPILWMIARALSFRDPGVQVYLANFWQVPLPKATTVVYAFSVKRDGKRLARKLQSEANRLKKPLSLLSYGNPLPDIEPTQAYEAYYHYIFQPMQSK